MTQHEKLRLFIGIELPLSVQEALSKAQTALKKAGTEARGAELYISLEPCAHYGKTPPCVDSIIKSGVKKVYVAMRDPNPLVNGKGLGMLRRHGIEVRTGICRQEAEKLNRDYVYRYC